MDCCPITGRYCYFLAENGNRAGNKDDFFFFFNITAFSITMISYSRCKTVRGSLTLNFYKICIDSNAEPGEIPYFRMMYSSRKLLVGSILLFLPRKIFQ